MYKEDLPIQNLLVHLNLMIILIKFILRSPLHHRILLLLHSSLMALLLLDLLFDLHSNCYFNQILIHFPNLSSIAEDFLAML